MVTLERVEVLRMALDRHEDDDKALKLAAQMFQLLEGGTDGPRLADGVNLEGLDIGPGQIQPVEPEQTDTPREPDARGDEAAASAEPATSETDEEPPSPRATPKPGTVKDKLWRALAELISETGLSPTRAVLAERAGVRQTSMITPLRQLVEAGFVRRLGSGRGSILGIEVWPEGVEPRATEGRAGKAYSKPGQGKPRRRFTDKPKLTPERVSGLGEDHDAVREKRTLFPSTVVNPAESPRLLVSGENSPKLGDRVTKGPWKGMPIYALTLEERATCPESCHHWLTCYGNGMPRVRRHSHGPALERQLRVELEILQMQHPGGFVVRLHNLGDFYSREYVQLWISWLEQYPALHVFGYTAWPVDTPIGHLIRMFRDVHWDRFAIRTSGQHREPKGATTIDYVPEWPRVDKGVVCPAQTGKTDCCGTCGLCWHPNAKDETIVFVLHGPRFVPKPARASVEEQDQAAIEAHIQENGVRRFEPGTIDSLIIQAFEAMGCKVLRWGHGYGGGADFQVDGKVVKRRDAIRSVNEYRLSIGQEPISLLEEGASGR